MQDQDQNVSPDGKESNLGLIIVFAFALGLPLVGMIFSYFTQTPK